MIPEGICYHAGGKGFGDHLVRAHAVQILNDNGVKAVLWTRKPLKRLIDVPLYDPAKHKDYTIMVDYFRNPKESLLMFYLSQAEQLFETKVHLDNDKHDYVPVSFMENPNIPQVDVTLCTETGAWTPYRNWPYFGELKKRLNDLKITYVDLSKDCIFGHDCLNYVKKCKVYLGLETGTSHYVSKFANHKGLIIQGGFTLFSHWALPYKYEAITAETECPRKPCYLRSKCPFNRVCIDSISVDVVLDRIMKYL